MGFFDKLKDKAKGVAGDALQAAVDTAQDKVKDAVADKVTDVAQQARFVICSHVGATPDSAAANVAQAATSVATETGVNVAADAATHAKGSGEGQSE